MPPLPASARRCLPLLSLIHRKVAVLLLDMPGFRGNEILTGFGERTLPKQGLWDVTLWCHLALGPSLSEDLLNASTHMG